MRRFSGINFYASDERTTGNKEHLVAELLYGCIRVTHKYVQGNDEEFDEMADIAAKNRSSLQ